MNRLLTVASLVTLLAACGGPSQPTQTARDTSDEEDDDRIVDEEGDEDDEEDDAGFVDAALLREASDPMELGDRRAVPGTGVSLQPPTGSRSIPHGSGFLAMRHRVQISVVVAVGGPEVLEAIRTGGAPDAPDPDSETEVTIAGQRGRLGRDQVESPSGTLERSWLLVHDGARGLGVVATYEADRARALRPGVREVLMSTEWDREAELDAAVALGIEVGPVQGLNRSNRSSANVVLIAPNADYPPDAGDPVITVSPLPMQIPTAQQEAVCAQLVARFVPAPHDDVSLEGPISDGALPGCERLATADTREGERVLTYAALLFNEGLPVLVTASAAASAIETWRPRFASAARTVRPSGTEGAAQ